MDAIIVPMTVMYNLIISVALTLITGIYRLQAVLK